MIINDASALAVAAAIFLAVGFIKGVLGMGFARDGAFGASIAAFSLLALAPALMGLSAGQWPRLRISAPAFRLWFLLGLLALGLHLALHRFL